MVWGVFSETATEFAAVLRGYRHFVNHFSGLRYTPLWEREYVATTFAIFGIALPKQVLDLLEDNLSINDFKKVSLCYNGGGSDLVKFIGKVLEINSYDPVTLVFTGKPIRSSFDFNKLIDYVHETDRHFRVLP